jgi:hypothetical protein
VDSDEPSLVAKVLSQQLICKTRCMRTCRKTTDSTICSFNLSVCFRNVFWSDKFNLMEAVYVHTNPGGNQHRGSFFVLMSNLLLHKHHAAIRASPCMHIFKFCFNTTSSCLCTYTWVRVSFFYENMIAMSDFFFRGCPHSCSVACTSVYIVLVFDFCWLSLVPSLRSSWWHMYMWNWRQTSVFQAETAWFNVQSYFFTWPKCPCLCASCYPWKNKKQRLTAFFVGERWKLIVYVHTYVCDWRLRQLGT